MNTNINLNSALEGVRAFNTIAGNLDTVSIDELKAQLVLCREELNEAIDDLEAGNMVGTLDGAVDMFVTGTGFMLQLERMGFNVNEALVRINANNLTKFVSVRDFAEDLVPDGATATFNRQHNRWVFKDANGKVKKPTNFVSVKINDLVPQPAMTQVVELLPKGKSQGVRKQGAK